MPMRLSGLRVHTGGHLGEDMNLFPTTHIKKFTTPPPKYLMPLSSKSMCIHSCTYAPRHTYTYLKIIIFLQNKTRAQRFYPSVYNIGGILRSSFIWWGSIYCISSKVYSRRLEWWLWGWECWLLSKRTQVWFTASIYQLTAPLIPVLGDTVPSSDLCWHLPGKHHHAQTYV